MDNDLQKLVSHLRQETCPREVAGRVARRIAQERSQRQGRTGLWTACAMASLFVAAAVAWQAQSRRAELARAAAELANRERVAQQAGDALAIIGARMLQAAAQTEKAILKEAMPPLRQSLQTAKNKVTNRI